MSMLKIKELVLLSLMHIRIIGNQRDSYIGISYNPFLLNGNTRSAMNSCRAKIRMKLLSLIPCSTIMKGHKS